MANVFAQCPEIITERQIRPKKITGGFVWAVCFRLPSPAEEDGYIIQQIVQQESGTQLEGGVAVEIPFRSINYWEAWEVKKGETEPQQKQTINSFIKDTLHKSPTADPDYDIPMNDIFYKQYKVGAKGYYYVSGLAGFYHGTLPSDFIVDHPDTGAGALKSTRRKPDFWTHSGFSRFQHLVFTYQTEAERKDVSKQSLNGDRGQKVNISYADKWLDNFYNLKEAGK